MINRKAFSLVAIALFFVATIMYLSACSTSNVLGKTEKIDKSGTELWAENCSRCHYAPPPSAFEAEEWEIVGLHMRMRTYLTGTEVKKIEEFLKTEE